MAGKFLGCPFGTEWGVTQGDPESPIIYNIVVDLLLRVVLEDVYGPQEDNNSLVWAEE